MDGIPWYVSTVFILTTFATVAFLLHAIKIVGVSKLPSQILIFLLPLWILFQAVLSIGGFYQQTDTMPPRMPLFAVLPTIILMIVFFVFFRRSFIERLPIKVLTLLHVVRIPVEIVLLWLSFHAAVPRMMTFEGRNFDILSGFLAIVVYLIAFRGAKQSRGVLIAFNIVGLILLANIVTIAILSLPSPVQSLNLDQPNRAVLFFPYLWLPAIVVPIVLFSHLAALWNLLNSSRRTS
jgi:hypothetical protein